jgi:hypothetical protein
MDLKLKTDAVTAISVEHRPPLNIDATPRNFYVIECRDAAGNLRWLEEVENLIPDAGANDLLSKYLTGASYTAAWYVGLIDNAGFTGLANGDTAASHPGWSEATYYSNANRPTLTLGAVSARSVSNSASPATFNINASGTINGAFVVSTNTKNGTTGVLYGEASFGSARSVLSGDTVNVTITLTA